MVRIINRRLIAALSALALLSACGGSSSSSQSDTDSTAGESSTPPITLQKHWETDTVLRAPESVLWDAAQEILYVSNINGDGVAHDDNGFISQLGPDGKIINLHWVNGLDAPKGIGMYGGELYAADIDSLVIIDMKAAKIKSKIHVPGSVFLNDVAVDDQGNVYISDTRQGKVFRYRDGKVSEYLSSPEVKGANGLLVWKNKLWIDAADGIYNYDAAAKKFNLFCKEVTGGDGLTVVNDNELIASRWIGEVYYIHQDGSAKKILDTRADKQNTADLYFLKDSSLLIIPTFNGNRVTAYRL